MEVEISLGRVVEPVLYCEFNQVLGCQIVPLVFRIVFTVAALVAGYEIDILGKPAGQPPVSAGILQVPEFIRIHESYSEAFGAAVLFDERPEPLHALAGGCYIWQDYIIYAVLSKAIGYIWICREHLFAGEYGLRGAHSHTCGVEAGFAPVSRESGASDSRISQPLGGEVAPEGTVNGLEFFRTVVAVLVDGQVHCVL